MDTAASPVIIGSPLDGDGRRALRLNRPIKANAVDLTLADALLHWVELSARDGCRALVIEAEGRNFCAGFDFEGFADIATGVLLQRFVALEQVFQILRSAPFVSVALVDGAAFGAGADLALACTYRIGTARARFRFPGYGFGVALGTRHLAHAIGMQAARDILLRNRVVGADEALALGLLTHATDAAAMGGIADGLLGETRLLSPGAIRRIHALTAPHDNEGDMAQLVRSLSEPGLHERIAAYRQAHA